MTSSKGKHFLRCWAFVRGINRSPVISPHKGQWRRGLMFSLICAWANRGADNGCAGDLRRHRAHYDVIVVCNVSSYCLRPGSSDLRIRPTRPPSPRNLRTWAVIQLAYLQHGFNILDKDNCKTRRETCKFWDMVRFILEIWRLAPRHSSLWGEFTGDRWIPQ